mgnify:FL=1
MDFLVSKTFALGMNVTSENKMHLGCAGYFRPHKFQSHQNGSPSPALLHILHNDNLQPYRSGAAFSGLPPLTDLRNHCCSGILLQRIQVPRPFVQ